MPLMRCELGRAQERGNDPVHQLEIGRERGRVLLGVVEDFFRCASDASSPVRHVDEDEFGPHESLALHVGSDRTTRRRPKES